MRAARKRGVEMEIMAIVEIIERRHSISDLILYGMLSSVASMSFVKRLTIRPMGVESKNRM
jgi:hypothetical protein